ncbi:MAG: DHH family phosphoesterase [Candidatus Aenigmarchaeota archaeon]|nr:DHH family phosphoesterase [Candidatus Aenigmarchaeota archaeon]
MDFSKAIEMIRKSNKILIVSHYDCDGLCSAKILSTALKKENKEISVRIAKELSKKIIEDIEEKFEKENFDLMIFSDLGSSNLSLLPNKDIIIFDHHMPEKIELPENIVQINPIVENMELCGAGVCYLFASKINNNQELIDYAIVGAIGDNQAEIGENRKIVLEAEKIKRLKIEKGLRLFGHINRPLHYSLTYSKLLPLKDCSEVVQFISDLKINLNHSGKIKSYYDLSKEEKERLFLGIIKERIRNNLDPTNIFSDIYLLTKQPRELMDALEFSTILNAFGRLEKFDEALKLLDGNLEKLEEVMTIYKRKLATYLSWTTENINNFQQTKNILFINAGEKIDENMIGTITSIIINSCTNKKIVVGLAWAADGVKISARSRMPEVDLNEVMNKVCEKLGGKGGGHKEAAGGKIEKGKEEKFIKLFAEEIKETIFN